MIILDFNNFKNYTSEGLCLVKFTASWCAPCRTMDPIMKEVDDLSDGKFITGVVDIDDNKAIAEKHGVFSIPMLIIYKDGKVVRRMAGVQSVSKIIETLNKYIDKNE